MVIEIVDPSFPFWFDNSTQMPWLPQAKYLVVESVGPRDPRSVRRLARCVDAVSQSMDSHSAPVAGVLVLADSWILPETAMWKRRWIGPVCVVWK